jgi:hypothetical protein
VRYEVIVVVKMMMMFFGADTLQTHRYILTFWRNILPPSSGIQMETVYLFEMVVPESFHGTTTQNNNIVKCGYVLPLQSGILKFGMVREKITCIFWMKLFLVCVTKHQHDNTKL